MIRMVFLGKGGAERRATPARRVGVFVAGLGLGGTAFLAAALGVLVHSAIIEF